MAHVLRVHVRDTLAYLQHDVADLLFTQLAVVLLHIINKGPLTQLTQKVLLLR